MIISKGLDNSGLTARLVPFLLAINRPHTKRAEALLMLFAGVMASFLRSFGTVAIFLPAINR